MIDKRSITGDMYTWDSINWYLFIYSPYVSYTLYKNWTKTLLQHSECEKAYRWTVHAKSPKDDPLHVLLMSIHELFCLRWWTAYTVQYRRPSNFLLGLRNKTRETVTAYAKSEPTNSNFAFAVTAVNVANVCCTVDSNHSLEFADFINNRPFP